MEDIKNIIDAQRDLKRRAKTLRTVGDFAGAESCISRALEKLLSFEASPLLEPNEGLSLYTELADCYGILGGIYRRWALKEIQQDIRTAKLELSCKAYDSGYVFEQKCGSLVSYNMLNRLVSRILSDPSWLNVSDNESEARKLLEESLMVIESQIAKNRDDIWAMADSGLNKLLLNEQDVIACFSGFVDLHPTISDYKSILDTLQPLASLDIDAAESIQKATRYLEQAKGFNG